MQHEMNAWDWIWVTPLTFSWIVPIALALYVIGVVNFGDEIARSQRWRRRTRFLCHSLEMTVAMVLGMVMLGTAVAWHEQTELAAFVVAFNMTLPIVALMRYRGQTWGRGIEMAAAMFLPAVALLVLLRLGLVSPHLVAPLQMALMLPGMVIVMLYRADEYVRHACTVRPGRAG